MLASYIGYIPEAEPLQHDTIYLSYPNQAKNRKTIFIFALIIFQYGKCKNIKHS